MDIPTGIPSVPRNTGFFAWVSAVRRNREVPFLVTTCWLLWDV